MLPTSRLYSFINHSTGFTLNFLEGSKLIEDLVLLHDQAITGFGYLRDFVLMGEHLTAYLKHQESMGIFIDSESPYLRLKLEISALGKSRTLLLPENLQDIPTSINGYCRLVKVNPFQNEPYTSFIRLENLPLKEAITMALEKSYQVKSQLTLSESTDQSVMLTRLPDVQVDKHIRESRPSLEKETTRIKPSLDTLFLLQTTDQKDIEAELAKIGYQYLSGQDIELSCSCEHSRMVSGIVSLAHSESLDNIFEGDAHIEVKCDYCKTLYKITRDEVDEFIRNQNS